MQVAGYRFISHVLLLMLEAHIQTIPTQVADLGRKHATWRLKDHEGRTWNHAGKRVMP